MTVCIAATSESGRQIVVLTDRMLVAGTMGESTTIQRSGKVHKIIKCTQSCLMMHSGTHECVHWVAGKLREWLTDRKIATVDEIYQHVKESALKLTGEMRDRYIKANLGDSLNHSDLSRTLSNGSIITHITNWQNAQQKINSGEFLIAGVDSAGSECVGSIYYVSSTIGSTSFSITDRIDSFTAIGCGGLHAREVLESYDYDSDWSLPNALYAVYCAKRAAELSPGVDKECDLRIISAAGIVDANGSVLESLKATYEAEWSKKRTPHSYPSIQQALSGNE
jgi:hypothetical protein